MCSDRPNYGSAPLIFASSGRDTQLKVAVTRVRRTSQATWRVTVAMRGAQDTTAFHVDTTVEKSAGHYRVCSAESR